MKDVIGLGKFTKSVLPGLDGYDSEVIGQIMLDITEDNFGTSERVQRIINRSSTDRGIIASWFRCKRSEARTSYNDQILLEAASNLALSAQQDALNEQRYQRTQVPIRRGREEQVAMLEHQAKVSGIKRKDELEEQAFRLGRTLETHQAVVMKEESTLIEFADHESRERLRVQLGVDEFHHKINAASSARYLEERRQIQLLELSLHQLYIEVEKVQEDKEKTIPEGAKARIIAQKEKSILSLEQEIDGRQRRLLQIDNGENGERVDLGSRPQPNVRKLSEKDSNR